MTFKEFWSKEFQSYPTDVEDLAARAFLAGVDAALSGDVTTLRELKRLRRVAVDAKAILESWQAEEYIPDYEIDKLAESLAAWGRGDEKDAGK